MEPIKSIKNCADGGDCCDVSTGANKRKMTAQQLGLGLLGLTTWYIVYTQLLPFSHYFSYGLFGFEKGSHLGEAIQFFAYDTPKVMMLLTLIVFVVGMLRSFFTQERTRKVLAGKRETAGNVMAALLGIVTPFCSCSAVPLFLGFVQAGVPLGVTFSFLIAAPMVNEIALVLLYGLLGWKVAAIYLGTGLAIAMGAGWVIGRLKLEHLIEDWVQELRAGAAVVIEEKLSWADRIDRGWEAVRDIVGKVWVYVVAGIAVGAMIHGYVPETFMASVMGKDAWWSVPVAVVVGIPMYSNAAGIVPVVEALLGKGAALGTVLAFMMSVIALSLPEMVILRKVLKPKLIAVFIGVVGGGILFTGFLFNLII
ncbi:MAG: permease [Proteobacteria bacterium]|nr:permease [Pseudomonadota bacterium]MBU1140819.1 permease [Pseudomonadota bacterium]MBU1233599.1 permease [Pseudomonadota bacterium]MBU1418891.1 permease [Pseudomonadota bacterium]MBU1455685.1 permease [Pseudomonadota bacterium]